MAKSKVYNLYKIKYDTDGVRGLDLPSELLVMVDKDTDIAEDGADLISDHTGWCVNEFKFKEADDIPEGMKIGDIYTRKK